MNYYAYYLKNIKIYKPILFLLYSFVQIDINDIKR